MIYHGGYYCGAVQFRVEAPEVVECQDCNCSICSKWVGLGRLLVTLKLNLKRGQMSHLLLE